MALPPNPLAQLVTQASSAVTAATSAASDTFKSLTSSASSFTSAGTAGLTDTVNRLGGGIGSGLNGATAGLNSIGTGLQNAAGQASGMLGQISSAAGTAMGGMGLPGGLTGGAQNLVAGAQSTLGGLTSAVGGIAGSVSNIAATVGNGISAVTGGFATAGGLGSGLLSIARNISAAAGQINNLLSLFRGRNIPGGADLFQQTGAQVKVTPVAANDWRVRINCDFNTLFGGNTFKRLVNTGGLVWPYTPNITISTKANYTQVDPVHNNFPFQAYKNSQVDDIQISGEFSCENASDAEYWIAATMFLRAATKMYYGQGQFAGNPPVICQLTGYGSMIFNSVPVIIKSFQVDLKDDVNYIQCTAYGTPTWVPVLSTISVTVAPIYNRERLRRFSLQNFAAGKELGMM